MTFQTPSQQTQLAFRSVSKNSWRHWKKFSKTGLEVEIESSVGIWDSKDSKGVKPSHRSLSKHLKIMHFGYLVSWETVVSTGKSHHIEVALVTVSLSAFKNMRALKTLESSPIEKNMFEVSVGKSIFWDMFLHISSYSTTFYHISSHTKRQLRQSWKHTHIIQRKNGTRSSGSYRFHWSSIHPGGFY